MFHALGDGSRRAMVERLSRGPASVSELARPFEMALPTVVQHLGVLEKAGIVSSAKAGRVRTYQLVPGALAPAAEWIGRQRLPAERRLDRLGAFLDQSTTTSTRGHVRFRSFLFVFLSLISCDRDCFRTLSLYNHFLASTPHWVWSRA